MRKALIFVCTLIVGGGVALAGSLNVPFIFSNIGTGSTGIGGFISLKNLSASTETITVVYTLTDATGGSSSGGTVTFALLPGGGVGWDPAADSGVEGGGQGIGNAVGAPGSLALSANVSSTGAAGSFSLVYKQVDFSGSAFAHAIVN